MDRRHFSRLTASTLGLSALASAGSAGGGLALLSTWVEDEPSYSRLPRDVRALYHEDFAGAFPDLALEDLMAELRRLGISSGKWVDIDRVRSNAARDPLVEFGPFLWTRSELLLYAVVARLHGRDSNG